MIEKMTKYSFLMLSAQKEEFLTRLQELGMVDITRSSKPTDSRSENLLSKIEELKKRISDITLGKDAQLESMKARLKALEAEKVASEPWGQFDKTRLDALGLALGFYTLPLKECTPSLASEYAMQMVSDDGKNAYVVVVCPSEGFPGKRLAAPERSVVEVISEIDALKAQIAAQQAVVEARKAEIPSLDAEIVSLSSSLSLSLAAAAGSSVAEGHVTVFEGFAPSEVAASLEAEFAAMDIVWLQDSATVEDNPPIKLRNNAFVRMFEVLTDMYGRPAYNGFDPTPYISVFFLLFFAMCMGDAGYGLVLLIVGHLLKKVESFKSLAPLVGTLGAATVVVGTLFHTFFSVDLLGMEWIPAGVKACMLPAKIAGYDGTMILALAIGILHLCLAMIVKTVYVTKNEGFRRSVSVWGWTLFIVGTVVAAVIALVGLLDMETFKWIVISLGIVSAIGIFPLRTPGKNPLVNIGAGLWETYNTATGILGDVLSYLRLYALGLAGSMLGYAFNNLAGMTISGGGSIGGWIAFVLIVIIGHTLNVAMAALGAFVHPLRLNFLEFFKNSGYEAAGKPFNPLQ